MEVPLVARFIVEILGAPKDFVTQQLKEHVDKVKTEFSVQSEHYAEPVAQDKLFMQFVELQISFKKMKDLLDFCFDSMPSSVEIISPEQLTLDTTTLEDFMNDFQTKLHHTDMMLKTIQAQKQVLDKNAINLFHNFIKYACLTKPHTIDQLSDLLGVTARELQPFVNHLVAKKIIKKEGEQFIHG